MASDSERLVRKLRKKLRQIENLEIQQRDLNSEEREKVERKDDIRFELSNLLPRLQSLSDKLSDEVDGFTLINAYELESDEMKRKSSEAFDNLNENKKSCPGGSSGPTDSNHEQDRVDTNVSREGTEDAEVQISSVEGPTQPSTSRGITGSVQSERTSGSSRTEEREKERERQKKKKSAISSWRGSHWRLQDLEGHSDLVLDSCLGPGVAVTASRDTTVKVWSVETGSLLLSLRGHTGPVTGVRLLAEDRAISAGQDCNLKIWDLLTGDCIQSYYTYNGITRLEILQPENFAITATDGGKLEMWDLETGGCLLSQTVTDTSISALASSAHTLVTADIRGTIKIFQLKTEEEEDGKVWRLSCVFQSEDLATSVNQRPITAIRMPGGGHIYFADAGSTLKLLEWKTGKLKKIANHPSDFGLTDCISETGDVLVVSSYDLDTGCGGLNILYREPQQPDLTYLATLCDGETSRVVSLACREDQGELSILTGGHQVKLWTRRAADSEENLLRAGVRSLVCSQAASDSELSEDETPPAYRSQEQAGPFCDKKSGFCNCNLM